MRLQRNPAWLAMALFAAMALTPTAAPAAVKCVRVHTIREATSRDGVVLRLRLNNGTILNNRLDGPCKGLRFGGFSWVVRNGEICENMQSVKVIQTGELCSLGRFDPEIKPKAR